MIFTDKKIEKKSFSGCVVVLMKFDCECRKQLITVDIKLCENLEGKNHFLNKIDYSVFAFIFICEPTVFTFNINV